MRSSESRRKSDKAMTACLTCCSCVFFLAAKSKAKPNDFDHISILELSCCASIIRADALSVCGLQPHVKRHARATLQYPGSQGTNYGGGMSVAPENSKLKTFHLEVKCHTKRSFHPTNQAKCRACYVLSTYWFLETESCKKNFVDKSCN